MKKHVLLAAAYYYGGLVPFIRWWQQRRPSVIILNYHTAATGNLRSHLLYLRRHYHIVPLEEALEDLYASSEQRKQLSRCRDRRTAIVLTFDDGYQDNYTHAFSLAQELQVPITIFLIPGYIESRRRFWWMEGDHLVQYAQIQEAVVDGQVYHLNQQEERQALAQTIYTRLRQAHSIDEREVFLEEVRKVLAVSGIVIEDEHCVLTWQEIHEMDKSGWVSFGAHTMHHPVLSHLTDSAELRREVSECRAIIEQQLGHPIHTFAYPFGRIEHIGNEAPEAAQGAGYAWALTTIPNINNAYTDPYHIRRIMVDVNHHWLLLAAEVTGVWRKLAFWLPYGVALWRIGEQFVNLLIKKRTRRKWLTSER